MLFVRHQLHQPSNHNQQSMNRTKLFLYASLLTLASFFLGAYVSYIWDWSGRDKATERYFLALSLPMETNEIVILSKIAQGLDTRDSAETKKAICLLISAKIIYMKDIAKLYSAPNVSTQEKTLQHFWSSKIAVAEGMSTVAKCNAD